MKRLRIGSLFCLLAGFAGLYPLTISGDFTETALYSFAALGLAGCMGLLISGLYALLLLANGFLSENRRRTASQKQK